MGGARGRALLRAFRLVQSSTQLSEANLVRGARTVSTCAVSHPIIDRVSGISNGFGWNSRTLPTVPSLLAHFTRHYTPEAGTGVLYPEREAYIGEEAPDFEAPAVVDGEITKISLADYKGKYVCLFFYPKDFTFVCPTEIIAFSDRAKEFEELGCQLIAASTDTEEVHLAWIRTPRKKGGLGRMQIPILADTTKEIAARYGVLLEKLGIALRGLFIIDPQGILQHITVNSLPIGRNVDEAKRVLQAVQFVAEHGEVCPAGWTPGGKTMVADPDKSLEYFHSVGDTAEEDFGAKLQKIASKKEFESVVASGEPVVIDFYAPWCGKCRQIAPYVEDLQDKHPGIKFLKFDTTEDALEQYAADLGVGLLPTFRFYKGGKEAIPSVTGYKKRPLEEAVEKLASA